MSKSTREVVLRESISKLLVDFGPENVVIFGAKANEESQEVLACAVIHKEASLGTILCGISAVISQAMEMFETQVDPEILAAMRTIQEASSIFLQDDPSTTAH